MIIRGTTNITGLFGFPVQHSLSPLMHNAAFEYLELDYCYVAFPVKPDLLGDAIKGIKAMDIRGVNVTVPHKENVIPFLDKVDGEASFIGAVNTILNSGGKLTGYNTDGRGFMESLAESGISASGKTILIVGAGGACRAIGYYLSRAAEKIFINDIDRSKLERLVADLNALNGNVNAHPDLNRLDGIDILINATPVGIKDNDPCPVNAASISKEMIVCDLIYKKTPLLEAASAKGCKTLNGLGMLLHQGALSFEIWTGVKPPVNIMRNAIAGWHA